MPAATAIPALAKGMIAYFLSFMYPGGTVTVVSGTRTALGGPSNTIFMFMSFDDNEYPYINDARVLVMGDDTRPSKR